MAMEIKKLGGSQIEIFIEVPKEKFDKYCGESFEEIAKNFEMPGFRTGKIPEKILKENIKEEDIFKKAAEKAIRLSYFPFLKEKKIEAIGRPEIAITKMARGNSFCYRVKTAVLPEINLPDYRKIAKDIKTKEKREAPTLAESEVGVPTSDAESRSVGKNEQQARLKEMKRQQRTQMRILEAIADNSQMEIPDILVETEKEKMLAELKSSLENMGLSWSDYLSHLKKTEDELRENWREDGLRRVKYGLILKELADKENVAVSDEEVEAEVSEISKQNSDFDKDYLRGYTYGMLRNEKVLKFLENI